MKTIALSAAASSKAPEPNTPIEANAGLRGRRLLAVCVSVNAAVVALLAVYLFVLPGGVLVICHVHDPALRGAGMPRIAWQVRRRLGPRYERWARERIVSGRTEQLAFHDVPSTEWPMFGSVYYLLATEALQDDWERDPAQAPQSPQPVRFTWRGRVHEVTEVLDERVVDAGFGTLPERSRRWHTRRHRCYYVVRDKEGDGFEIYRDYAGSGRAWWLVNVRLGVAGGKAGRGSRSC
jgi:hypothetical protein